MNVVAKMQTPPPTSKPAPPKLASDPNVFVLGQGEYGAPINIKLLKLIEGRLLVQGTSGAGKSWTLRRLLELTAAAMQQIIIDAEGEFQSLAELCGHLYIDASELDVNAMLALGHRVREQRISVVIDLSDLQREKQMVLLSTFLQAIVNAPREFWTSCVVAVDEAHLFAPLGASDDVRSAIRRASIAAIADVMGRGRKRGLLGILATQRLARLAKSTASDVHNFLIGINTLDLDIKRAGETIGWGARKASDRLPALTPGDFVAVGPAFSQSPAVVKVGPVTSKHIGATPAILPAAQASDARSALGIDQLVEQTREAAAAAADDQRIGPGAREVRAFVREPQFSLAGQIYDALKALVPDGTTMKSLAKHLKAEPDDVALAVGLLQTYGITELSEDAATVRIDRNFAKWRV